MKKILGMELIFITLLLLLFHPVSTYADEDEFMYQRVLELVEEPEPIEEISTNGVKVVFSYNDSKQRIKKISMDNTVEYFYEDGILVRENGVNNISFMYSFIDGMYLCTSISMNNNTYTLVYDEMHNVESICTNDGSVICKYIYVNTFPKVYENKSGRLVLNEDVEFIGNINPIRYQGWYYDKEIKHYYVGEGIYYDAVRNLYVNNPYKVKNMRSTEPAIIQTIAYAYSYFMSSSTYGATAFANDCVSEEEWEGGERWYSGLEHTEVIARCIFAENDGLKETVEAGTSENNGYNDRVAEAVVIMNRVEEGLDTNPYSAVTRKYQFSSINPGNYVAAVRDTAIARRAKSKTNSAWKEATLLACTLSYTTDRKEFEYMRTVPEYINGQKSFLALSYVYNNNLFSIQNGCWIYQNKEIEEVALAGVVLLEPVKDSLNIIEEYNNKGYNIFFDFVD